MQKFNMFCSSIKNFEKALNITIDLLKDVETKFFSSPYSVVPLISQILGLNTPLMGSGDDPYSVTSIIFYLQNKQKLLRDVFKIPLPEKRMIIDEIYEMIAPSLLGEEDNYIKLLINTKYKHSLGSSQKKTKEAEQLLKEKFSFLLPFINKFHTRNGDFGYIVHYGYPEDLYREYDFLRTMPKPLSKEWRDCSFPIVNEMVLDNFPADGNKIKKWIKGWVLFISNYTSELLESGKLRKMKILQASVLAEKLGAKIIGMGGLIASFAQGGQWLSEQIKNAGFTTGHAYTIGNILEMMDICIKKVNLDIRRTTVAVVGAAGSIGSGCAKLLAERAPKEIILIDLNSFSVQQKLEDLKNIITCISSASKVNISTSISDMKKADIIIVATNSPASIIKQEYLKPGVIVVDDSFPKNVSKNMLAKRKDIILLEGGIMQLPASLNIHFARNMPDLMDAPLTRILSCKETYGCFAETLVLALYGHTKNYGLGFSDPNLAKDILIKAKSAGFSSAPLQCFDEAVEEERFEKISHIITNEYTS